MNYFWYKIYCWKARVETSRLVCLFSKRGSIVLFSIDLDKELPVDMTHRTIKQSLSRTMIEPTNEQADYKSINYKNMHYSSLDKPILYIPKTVRQKLRCFNLVQNTPTVMREKCYNNIVASEWGWGCEGEGVRVRVSGWGWA